jgi:flagella basal body P-ring formation protein FlgA
MRFALLAALVAWPACADTVVAKRTIRAQEVITAADIRLDPTSIAGAFESLDAVIGQEARVALYPGRAVMVGSVGAPALVDRNQIVEIVYNRGGLRIAAEGRALGRGGAGERIRVMNISSRSTLFGTIEPDGTVLVSK